MSHVHATGIDLALERVTGDWHSARAPLAPPPVLTIRYMQLHDDRTVHGLPAVVIARARTDWPGWVEFEVASGRFSPSELEQLFRAIEHEVLDFRCDATPCRGRYLVRHPDPDAPQTPLTTGMRVSFDATARTITIERPQ